MANSDLKDWKTLREVLQAHSLGEQRALVRGALVDVFDIVRDSTDAIEIARMQVLVACLQGYISLLPE